MKDAKLNSKKLSALIELSSNVKIYVPSTINTSEEIDNEAYIVLVLGKLSEMFGGATSFEALGCWQSNSGLIKERVTICQSYCTEKQLQENIDKVVEICEELKNTMNQEAISLEVNNKLYFV